MEKVTEILENLENLGDVLPKLDTLTGWFHWLILLAVRMGPVCILVLGLIHLLIPPKEANRKAGFRTYFGMGSITAWHFTQRVSGVIMTVLGLILTVTAFLSAGRIARLELLDMAHAAFQIIKVQVILIFAVYVFMFVLTAVMFDRSGNCRFPAFAESKFGRLLFVKESAPKKKRRKAAKQEYETQGEGNVTAEDIVIEYL